MFPKKLIFSVLLVSALYSLSDNAEAKSAVWTRTEGARGIYTYLPSGGYNPYYDTRPGCTKDASGHYSGSGSWGAEVSRYTSSISYVVVTRTADLRNASTGSFLYDGSYVKVGETIRLEPKLPDNTDVFYFNIGFYNDSPYGFWSNGSTPLIFNDCFSNYSYRSFFPSMSEPDLGNLINSEPLYPVINYPSFSYNNSGTAGLSCREGGRECTVTSHGSITSTVTFERNYGIWVFDDPVEWIFGNINGIFDIPAQSFSFSINACVSDWGSGCSSSATNSCGDRTYGYVQCDGSCSATSAPPERYWWNQSCSLVSYNACGQIAYGSGRTDCNSVCTGTPPSPPPVTSAPSSPLVYLAGSTFAYDLDGSTVTVAGGATCDGTRVRYRLEWQNQDGNVNEDWVGGRDNYVTSGGPASVTQFVNYPPGTYRLRAWTVDDRYNWSSYSERAITLSEVACTAANVCGQTRNGAQRDHRHGSGGYCNVGPPPVTTPNGTTYGAACPLTSIGNACGQTATADTGAIQCNGSCVGTPPNPPSNLSCPPTKPTVQGLFQDGASLGHSAPAFNDEGYEVRAYSISPGNQKLRYFFEWSKDGVNWTEGDRPGRPAGEWNTLP